MTERAHCTLPDCATCTAHDRSVFAGLIPVELNTLSQSKSCRTYAKGELIFFADEYPTGLFCVHRGTVKIYRITRDGKEHITRLARPGDIVGYRSLISGTTYEAFAAPIEEAQICHIPRDSFFTLTGGSADLSTRILTLMANELRAAETRIVEMAQKSVRERLAEILLVLKESHGVERDTTTLRIRLTRTELANIIGSTTESVSRLLSAFKDEKVVGLKGRRISIVDHDELVRIANVND